jgi:DeoR/GlpR family transcriptional regulator of sugar metabolism
MTVRRDLELLHEQRLLEKVHGGATSVAPSALFEPGFRAKAELQQDAKELIAPARRPTPWRVASWMSPA